MSDKSDKQSFGWNPMRVVRYVMYFISAVLIGLAIKHAVPPSTVIIETGPVGGSYYETAQRYKAVMERRGVTVELRPNPESLEIIQHVENADNDVKIGFIAQPVNRDDFPNTLAAGAIELQPLFGFYAASMGEIGSLSSLRGRRIVMPPERSATSEAATRILKRYGITPENTDIRFMPIAEAAKALHDQQADAGFFMLAPANAIITNLATDDDLRILAMPEAITLSRLEPYLTPTILPKRIYDVENSVPPEDIPLLAATVNVVVRKDLHPAILYLLLDAMSEVHQGPSLVNAAGVFPNLNGLSLAPHPLAKEYQKAGMPWIYRDLPLPIAGLIDYYLIIGVAIFLLTEIYKSSKYLSEFLNLVFEVMSLRLLARIERRTRAGKPVSAFDLMLVHLTDRALSRSTSKRRSQELIGRIRQSAGETSGGN